jgi:hypothetical protein
MLAGDSFLVLIAIFWLSVAVGPPWIGGVVILISLVLNYIHGRIIVFQKIESIQDISAKTGLPIPPHLQIQIDEVLQKGFRPWGSPPKQ